MHATPFETQIVVGALAGGAALGGAWATSLGRAKREQQIRAAERRQVFEVETLTRLADTLMRYTEAIEGLIDESYRKGPGWRPGMGPLLTRLWQAHTDVYQLAERVMDQEARTLVWSVLMLGEQITQGEGWPLKAGEGIDKDLRQATGAAHRRIGLLLRQVFEPAQR